ncbi:hypothetical protein QAD02_007725 [Eretmocerus hayati]|uniref:Uncharacterized protein n=1 Tax=Eretmocerus hayati TaxID=131215 RepID=A0ACC2N5R2_9HYME|nr:hypothetical protein QAD02_007725 [Eretmocerus hayati]
MIFGRILELIIHEKDNIYILCEEWPASHLEESLNAYVVTKGSKTRLITPAMLYDHKPFSLWRDYVTNNRYISMRHLTTEYSPVYPIREWVSNIKTKEKPRKNYVNSLDKGVLLREDRSNVIREVVKSFIIANNDNHYPDAALKIQLARDIIEAFPKLRDRSELGHVSIATVLANTFIYSLVTITLIYQEYLYDPKTATGLIQERLKTLRKSLTDDEKKRASTPRSSTAQLCQSTPDASEMEVDIDDPSLDEETFIAKVEELQMLDPEKDEPKIIELMDETRERRQKEIKKVTLHAELNSNQSQLKILLKYPRFMDYDGGLKSDPNLIINGGGQNTTRTKNYQPYILCNLNDGIGCNYRIVVDGDAILVGKSTKGAIELLLQTHYVFDIQFCRELQNFYNFLTSYFMNLTKANPTNVILNISLTNVEL